MNDNEIKKIAKSIKNNYHNNWQKQNPEKVREAQERYWQKKAKEIQIQKGKS